jgi:hypothetical protein
LFVRSSRRTGIFVFICKIKPVSNTVHTTKATQEHEYKHPPKSTLPTSFPFSANPSSQPSQNPLNEQRDNRESRANRTFSAEGTEYGAKETRGSTTLPHVIVIVVVWEHSHGRVEAGDRGGNLFIDSRLQQARALVQIKVYKLHTGELRYFGWVPEDRCVEGRD